MKRIISISLILIVSSLSSIAQKAFDKELTIGFGNTRSYNKLIQDADHFDVKGVNMMRAFGNWEFKNIGKIKLGAGVDFILGGISIEREMRSPPAGGAFFDKKVTKETKILGYYDKKEYYQGGLQSQSYPTQPAYSNGVKFGFNVQLFLGAKVDIEIRRK